MSTASTIEWTEATWNPVTGCTKISAGCKNCYAERMAARLKLMGLKRYENGFELTTHEDALDLPLKWKKPQRIFVNSMSDLFHKDVPLSFIQEVFQIMNKAHWHQFQVLTKRADRLEELSNQLPWSKNIWMGVSVEDQNAVFRVDHLRRTGASIKFLSVEPLIAPITNLNLDGIDWVIVGGESGPGARPMLKEWVLEVKEACDREDVAFFFKQWGGTNKKAAGRQLDGQTFDAMPREAGQR